jgi:hypothetical protein
MSENNFTIGDEVEVIGTREELDENAVSNIICKGYKGIITNTFFNDQFKLDNISFGYVFGKHLKHIKKQKEIQKTGFRVIQNNNATVVFFEDGTKEVVIKSAYEEYDLEKALAMCCAKKLLGGYTKFKECFGEYLSVEVEEEFAIKEAVNYIYTHDGVGDKDVDCFNIHCDYDKCPLTILDGLCVKNVKGREIEIANHFKKVRANKEK